jgi:hypothetical protein
MVLAAGAGLVAGVAACGPSSSPRHAAIPAASAAGATTAPAAPSTSDSNAPAPPVSRSDGAGSGQTPHPRPQGAASGQPKQNPAAAPNPATCSGSVLQAQLRTAPADGSRRTGSVGLRNTAQTACTLSGFPDLQLLGTGNDPISTLGVRTAGTPGAVVVGPGRTAWAGLTWITTPAFDEPSSGPCEPAAVQLAVFAPNDRTQLSIAYAGGPVCDHGRITIAPLTTVD